jgi:para-aminobenzoate synthetase component I
MVMLASKIAPTQFVHTIEELDLKLPFWRYLEVFRQEEYAFLLDSARDPEKLGQYSFIGGDPFFVYEAKRVPNAGPGAPAKIRAITRRDEDGRHLTTPIVEHRETELFKDLERTFSQHEIPRKHYRDRPVPLLSGAIGYFGYECNYFVEKLPDLGEDDLQIPEISLMFVDVVFAHDHRSGKSYLSVIGRGSSRERAEENGARIRRQMKAKVIAFENAPTPEWTGPDESAPRVMVEVHAHADEPTYVATVNKAKEHITAGDIFEVCTTHRLDAPFEGEPWDLYCELRRINPSPFACYLQFPFATVVSSSPERFMRLDDNRIAESRPIKGTRPRGKTPEEDAALRADLFGSIKDRAENVMIVDLVRNDIGRVSEIDSVQVPELMVIEPYATVFQMVSTIQGKLREDVSLIDLIKASFPGGSMTGAPKIEAMKIIDALEPYKRGIYSGAIGYLDFSGTMDLNIVIRTFVVKDGRAYFSVGGAVVADSDPVGEYRETMVKARALIRALENVQRATR